MSAGFWNIEIEQHADYARTITLYVDPALTQLRNLTGYTAKMQARDSADALKLDSSAGDISLVLGGAAGTIAISITKAEVDTLVPGTGYSYDLVLVSAGGVSERILQGSLSVLKGVTA